MRPSPGGSTTRASAARQARAEVDQLTDEELAPRLEALYYLGWAETYLERYADGIGRFERGLEIARATGDGRLLIPMMLGKNYAARDDRAPR